MKILRTIVGMLMCALLVSAAVLPPAVAGGSTYSRFGVGDLVRYGGSRLDDLSHPLCGGIRVYELQLD
jgi:hypothetical protein